MLQKLPDGIDSELLMGCTVDIESKWGATLQHTSDTFPFLGVPTQFDHRLPK